MAEDEKVSAQEIGAIIARDQVLSAKILRLVNSPVYGFPGRISSVTHALVLLGFNVVKGLVLTTAVFDNLAVEARGFWEHSLGVAILSRRIAKALNVMDHEEIMIAGLLHDLGKVTLSFLFPDAYREAVQAARAQRCHIGKTEREAFEVDHTRVACWLAWRWHLPDRLTDAITYHHSPSRARPGSKAPAIVHVADILARGMGYGDPGDNTMPSLDHEAFQKLGLSFEDIDRVLEEGERDYAKGVDLFSEGKKGP